MLLQRGRGCRGVRTDAEGIFLLSPVLPIDMFPQIIEIQFLDLYLPFLETYKVLLLFFFEKIKNVIGGT